MGKSGKKKQVSRSSGPPTKIARSRGSFVTVGAMNGVGAIKPTSFKQDAMSILSATPTSSSNSKAKAVGGLKGGSSDLTEQSGRVWKRKHEKLDEAVYYISLSEPQPLLVVVDDEVQVSSLNATLKNLYPPHESTSAVHTAAVTLKTARKALEKTLRKNMHTQRGIMVVTRECVKLTKSCLPDHVRCKTVVHASGVLPAATEVAARAELCRPAHKLKNSTVTNDEEASKKSAANVGNNIFLVESGTNVTLSSSASSGKSNSKGIPLLDVQRSWMPCLQARCSAARKLAAAVQQGNTVGWSGGDRDAKALDKAMNGRGAKGQTDEGQALAGRVEGLRAKLKIAMITPLPGITAEDAVASAAGTETSLGVSTQKQTSCSSKSRRVRMECLGMVHTLSQEERKFQAETGRTLAATRWLDSKTSKEVFAEFEVPQSNAGWGVVRFGASLDSVSATIRTMVEGFRDFVAMRTKKSGRKLPKREDETQLVEGLSADTKKALVSSRITGLGWRPSPFGEGDAWGGKYGKCCAHNEVALFYARPFFPQEVLNTHICSKASPAPGNEGYDGCLEFMVAQCRHYQRAMTVWDDRFFHHISVEGVHSKVDKSELMLKHSESELKELVAELRVWTIASMGQHKVQDFMKTSKAGLK